MKSKQKNKTKYDKSAPGKPAKYVTAGPQVNSGKFNEEVKYAIDNLSRYHPAVTKVQDKVKGKLHAHFKKMGFGASDMEGGDQ